MFPRVVVCLRNISVDTLHKGDPDDDDDDDNNNNNNNNNNTLNPLNAKVNPTCHLLALLEAHSILHVSRVMFNFLKAEQSNLSNHQLY
jgi:hypothetical protein